MKCKYIRFSLGEGEEIGIWPWGEGGGKGGRDCALLEFIDKVYLVFFLPLMYQMASKHCIKSSSTLNHLKSNPFSPCLLNGGKVCFCHSKMGGGMLVVSLRGVNFGFWSHLGFSGQNTIIFSYQVLI